MRVFSGLFVIVLAVLAILASFSLFIVKQTRQAVVLEFGELVRVVNANPKENNAGLYTKMPWYDVIYFDKRILDLDARPLEAVTAGKVPLIIDAFGRYQINNPLKLYQSVLNVQGANRRLESILEKSLRGVLGASTYLEIVRDKRELMMSRILTEMNQTAESIGVKFIDVRIKRADLPPENSKKVFERMISERVRVAKKIRAEGNEKAQIIRAKTDREVIEIKAEANRRASITRGEGDAERNNIYAAAFGKDPDFFAFYRSMEAYEKGLKAGNTRMLMSPDSEFFRYFNQASGKR